MPNLVSTQLMSKGRILFFNEENHKYVDDLGNPYISVTTLIHKYTEEFKENEIAKACERIGKNPNHPKYLTYKGKSAKQLKLEWQAERDRACSEGTKKHNYLEDCIKSNNGYKKNAKGFIDDRIYTIDDIIKNHRYGILNIDSFAKSGIKDRYPTIYNTIAGLVNVGFKIYAEIGTYDYKYLVSGLIDVLLVRDKEFIILDWKTNKAPIKFEGGYWSKNKNGELDFDDTGNILNEYNYTGKTFQYPLDKLEDSYGNIYAMQLSTYAHLVETFGYKCVGLILCHIRTVPEKRDIFDRVIRNEFQVVEIKKFPYLKNEVVTMLNDYAQKNINNTTINKFI